MRPLCFLRNFVRFGCSISYRSSVPAAAARTAGSRTILEFLLAAVPGRRIVLENLALEDPDLDSDDAEGDHAHGVLHRPLHRAAEADPAFELLGDAFGDERRIEFGLSDLDDVEVQLGLRHRGKLLAERLDIRALLADDDTGPGGVDCHTTLAVRTLV